MRLFSKVLSLRKLILSTSQDSQDTFFDEASSMVWHAACSIRSVSNLKKLRFQENPTMTVYYFCLF